MASFCRNCGSSLDGNAAFCPKCGTPHAGPPNRSSAPVTSASKSSSALKIILIVCCCLAILGASVIGGTIYLAYRVKQAVVQKAAENGVDLNALSNSSTHNAAAKRLLPKVCRLITKEEVSRIIGQPIDRAEIRDAMCMFYGPPGLSAKLAQEQASSTFKHTETTGSEANGTDFTKALDQLVNNTGAQGGDTESNGERPLLMLGIDADGKAQFAAISAAKAIFSGIGQSATAKGIAFGADVPNLGDKAIQLPKLGLNVLQGDTLIRVIPGPLKGAEAKTGAVARAVLARL